MYQPSEPVTGKTGIYFGIWLPNQEHHAPIKCGILGGFLIGVIGVLLPPVMFWGEFEINTLAKPSRPLAHIWPKAGFWGTGVFLDGYYPPWMYLLIGLVKLLAISITVLSGAAAMHLTYFKSENAVLVMCFFWSQCIDICWLAVSPALHPFLKDCGAAGHINLEVFKPPIAPRAGILIEVTS